MKLQSNADRLLLKRELQKRLNDYYQNLARVGLSTQDYDVLRGRIAELTELIDYLDLEDKD
ncbi:hypothetical protein [Gallibacterium genomosp. 1]|uniref:hypothetical protein n=1 Tax=Gallibacterium genomosp. 1 TaxID=155515 RepID=UPI0008028705|nr:hypothetical protein [Gallibacterium genomosp. 1]OBX02207.1 hypothetical protein QV04_04015 [Gallibacterium genomosp. 1]